MCLPIRLLCCSTLFFIVSAWADSVKERPVAADTPDKFAQTVIELHQQMNRGGRYEFVRPDEKTNVETDLNTMAAILQKGGSVDRMTQSEKVRLFNSQEHLNGILTHTDKNRLICEHRAPVGTSIPRTTCQTYGEVETARRASNKFLQESSLIGSVCVDSKCRSGQ
jgi:hypothetical protein